MLMLLTRLEHGTHFQIPLNVPLSRLANCRLIHATFANSRRRHAAASRSHANDPATGRSSGSRTVIARDIPE
jgi:hypothetical protein